jgi:glucose/arabinose dehydrogenase
MKRRLRMKRRLLVACVALGATAHAADRLPRAGERIANAIRAGFTETVIADSLDSPVSMAIAPDGRVFVCEQAGRLRVIENGRLLKQPFVTVPTKPIEEEGLLGAGVRSGVRAHEARVRDLHVVHADAAQRHRALHRVGRHRARRQRVDRLRVRHARRAPARRRRAALRA